MERKTCKLCGKGVYFARYGLSGAIGAFRESDAGTYALIGNRMWQSGMPQDHIDEVLAMWPDQKRFEAHYCKVKK